MWTKPECGIAGVSYHLQSKKSTINHTITNHKHEKNPISSFAKLYRGAKLCHEPNSQRVCLCRRACSCRQRMGIARKTCTQQRTTASLVLFLSGYRKCPQGTPRKFSLLEITQRNLEIQLGENARTPSERFLQTRI